jgi:uncharacterized small protein (DUF1192 family)
MMTIDDDQPKIKAGLVVGDNLDAISVGELEERVRVFQLEIERLQTEIARKNQSKSAADAFFKR